MERTFKIEKELKITTENIVDCGAIICVIDYEKFKRGIGV